MGSLDMPAKFDHITPVIIDLHWLPVQYRIDFKILQEMIVKCELSLTLKSGNPILYTLKNECICLYSKRA